MFLLSLHFVFTNPMVSWLPFVNHFIDFVTSLKTSFLFPNFLFPIV